MTSHIKRLMDTVLSVLGIITLSPILGFVAVIVYISMGAPVFFRQQRPGLNGRLFTLLKFRTMLNGKNSHGELLSDEQRLTPLGMFLRKTSLDELPELINVLRGEMSIVGPRPLLVEYLPLYTPEQMRRHEVKPGITGWAQVNGRNALSWEEKFEYDIWYVDNWSLWLDIKILGMTFVKVISREGIKQEGHATMPPFTGSISRDQSREIVGDNELGDIGCRRSRT